MKNVLKTVILYEMNFKIKKTTSKGKTSKIKRCGKNLNNHYMFLKVTQCQALAKDRPKRTYGSNTETPIKTCTKLYFSPSQNSMIEFNFY